MGKKKKNQRSAENNENSIKSCAAGKIVSKCTITCPSLKVLVPSYDLSVEDVEIENPGAVLRLALEMKDMYESTVFAIENAVSCEECDSWIALGEKLGFLEAKHAASAGYAHRDNGRLAVFNPEIANLLWLRIKPFAPEHLHGKKAYCLSPNLRLYRYCPGQRFGKHYDESCLDEASGGLSLYTVLVYLNDGNNKSEVVDESMGRLQGGETVFYKGNTGATECARITPKTGSIILHEHGDNCLLHAGAPVRGGVKYLLRTDVVYV